ncbi:hypothetical protein [Plantibacter sp. YIM 135249]|uniref:hypothetical protein n=1 Tax=Plantibacter sp. YIM 135249 TaxID=3423918 RepID=UPI003D33E09E
MIHELLIVAATAVITAGLGAAGWAWRRRVHKRDINQAFLRSRIDQRDQGFTKLLAGADGLQFLKADGFVRSVRHEDQSDYRLAGVQATALFHDGMDEIRSNVGDTTPVDAVWNYLYWVFVAEHAPGQAPAVDEYERIRELVVRCKRICQEQDRAELTVGAYSLSENHDYYILLRLAAQSSSSISVSDDGTMAIPMDGDAMAQWLEQFPKSTELWSFSREIALDRANRSGLYTALPSGFDHDTK